MQEKLNKRNIESLFEAYKKQQGKIASFSAEIEQLKKNNLNLSNKITLMEQQIRVILADKFKGGPTQQ